MNTRAAALNAYATGTMLTSAVALSLGLPVPAWYLWLATGLSASSFFVTLLPNRQRIDSRQTQAQDAPVTPR